MQKTEYVYAITELNNLPIPINQRPIDSWNYGHYGDVNGLEWHNNANVTDIIQYMNISEWAGLHRWTSARVNNKWTVPVITHTRYPVISRTRYYDKEIIPWKPSSVFINDFNKTVFMLSHTIYSDEKNHHWFRHSKNKYTYLLSNYPFEGKDEWTVAYRSTPINGTIAKAINVNEAINWCVYHWTHSNSEYINE